jgi:hypothetical protein
MRVTDSPSDDLDMLQALLNWDGDSPEEGTGLYYLIDEVDLTRADFVEGITPSKLAAAKKLRQEITADLLPLIGDRTPSQRRHLEALVLKVSGIGLKPHWTLEFGDQWIQEAQLQANKRGFEVVSGRTLRNPQLQYLGTGHRLLRLKTPWIVRRFYPPNASLKERLYWAIATSLETGDLSKLKRCPHCEKYFFALTQKREYCSDKCRYRLLNTERQRRGYFKQNRKDRKKKLFNEARALLRKGKSKNEVLELMQNGGLSRKDLRTLKLLK